MARYQCTPTGVVAAAEMWFIICSVVHKSWLINGDVNITHGTYCIKVTSRFSGSVPCLKLLYDSVSVPRPRFDPRPAHVGVVEVEIALGQIILSVFQFSPVSTILQMLHAHSFIQSPPPFYLSD
jgi:hypothetical protein